MRLNQRDSQGELKIYLFSVGGNLIWSNVDETSSESVLLSAFIASLYSFSKEFLVEDLYELQINELNIYLHSILDRFLIAILYNKNDLYYDTPNKINKELKEKIEHLINDFTETAPNNSIFEVDEDIFETFIISILEDTLSQLQKEYENFSEETLSIVYKFSSLLDLLDKKQIGISLYYFTDKSVKKLFNYYGNRNKGLKQVVTNLVNHFSEQFIESSTMTPSFFYYNGIFSLVKKKPPYIVILSKKQETIDNFVLPTYDYLNRFFEQEIIPLF